MSIEESRIDESSGDSGPGGRSERSLRSVVSLVEDRYRNKGTAFTESERDQFRLHGLLPPGIETLELQIERVQSQYAALGSDIERHLFLRSLQESNSVLFYSFLQRDLSAHLPVIYTPTVGEACQRWSAQYGTRHGLYLSWPLRHRIDEILEAATQDLRVDLIVATNGERVLGLGDLGAGGMGISIGKLALYSAVGGLNPATTLPVLLDAGTENEHLLNDPLYLGWRHPRVRSAQLDELVDAFVSAIAKRYPHAVLQWEDFATEDAERLLLRHRTTTSSFNDDIQGTACIAAAAILRGLRVANTPATNLRVVIVGAGSAGCGIASAVTSLLERKGLTPEDAKSRCWLVDRWGLVHLGQENLSPGQRAFARTQAEHSQMAGSSGSLVEIVNHVKPHALVGVCAQPGVFARDVITAQASHVQRPIVLPLSNPDSRAEAAPANVLEWTEGRALVGTGSSQPAIRVGGQLHRIPQVNNVYAFPGIGLGALSAGSPTITDQILNSATDAIVEFGDPGSGLTPSINDAPAVAREVARAITAESHESARTNPRPIDELTWDPAYVDFNDEPPSVALLT